MRLRLGLLRDTAVAEKQSAAETAARKFKSSVPTVKTEAATKAEEAAIAKAKAAAMEAAKPSPAPHIRPLSEAKAIESGANFISEAFLFVVAGGLIVFESWRSRRKETTRREDVEVRLTELEQSEKAARRALILLEKEIIHLKIKHGELLKATHAHILPHEIWEVEAEEDEKDEFQSQGWFRLVSSYIKSLVGGDSLTPGSPAKTAIEEEKPSPKQPSRPATPTMGTENPKQARSS